MSLALARSLLLAELLSRAQLAHHLAHAIRTGRSLARVLADADEELLLGALANDPTEHAAQMELDHAALERLPAELPDALGVAPLRAELRDGEVLLAMIDPSDRQAVREVERLLGQRVVRVRARPKLLLQLLQPQPSTSKSLQQQPIEPQPYRPAAAPFTMGATGAPGRPSRPTERPGARRASWSPAGFDPQRSRTPLSTVAFDWGAISSQPMTPRLPTEADGEPALPLVRRATPDAVVQSRPTRPTPASISPSMRAQAGVSSWPRVSLLPPAPRSLTPSVLPGAGLSSFTRMPLDEYAVRLNKLREARHRDDLTGELLTLAHAVAERALVMAVKGDRYVGWAGSLALGNVRALSVSAREPTVFTRAALEDGYLGPLMPMPGHHALLELLTGRADGGLQPLEIALWPVLASRRPALFVLATRLTDPLVATQRLSEICQAASQGLLRLLRTAR